jgi:hypothetical protein
MNSSVVIVPVIWFYITVVAALISFSIVVSCVFISLLFVWVGIICESLLPQHGASLGVGWRNGLWIWRVAPNILNRQSRTADKGQSSSLAVGGGVNNSTYDVRYNFTRPQTLTGSRRSRIWHWPFVFCKLSGISWQLRTY